MTDKQLNSVQSPTDAAALRKQAEEQTRTMEPTSLSAQTPEEIQRIFNELRVHQIELEMQNEELRSAQAQFDVERACYFDLYDQAPVGYCTLSEKGLILEGNLTAATLLGVNRSALVKQPFSRFILKEDLDVYYLYRKHLFDPGEPQEIELRLVKLDGRLFWVHLTATVAQAEDDAPVCRMIFSDITKRKGVERELFLRENIIKSSSCAIATCDLEGNMIDGNPFFYKLWEFNRLEDFLGKPFQNFWMLDGHDKEVMRALQSEGTWEGELKGIKKDGSLFDVQVSAATVLDDTGNPIALTSTSIDITDRKRREIYHGMGQEILRILNEPGDLLEAIKRIIVVLKTMTGVDAVGLRLQDGEDFPYFSQDGFSREFLVAENTLIKRGKDGGVCRDKNDNICLECTCGLVISGKTDPANPLFTQGGSCWTNDSFPLLDLPSDQDPRLHPRNICIHQGYASVALIPVRTRERIVGLIQLNDKRKGRFTLETIEVLEGIAGHIGSTLMRKHAEEALKENEFRARAMLQAIPDMMFRLNSHGVFLDYKADISDLYAQDIPTIIGKRSRDILPPEFIDLIDEKTRTALKTGSLQTFEYQLSIPGRGMRDYEGRMIRSAADEVTTIVRDITERNRVEEALRKSEELLTASQSLSKVGGWEWNVETQTMYWTEETYRIHDFTPGEMELGSKEYIKRSMECYEPEDRPVILAAFQRCVEEGLPYDLELPFTTAKGRRVWIRTNARSVRESGKVIRVIGNIIDITDRKRAEETLLAERKRLEFIIDGSRLGTWIWNVQTNETIFNEAWATMLGYTLGELTPTSVETWIALTHPEDLKKAEALLASCLAGKTRDYTCELRMKHKGGNWVWILDRGRIMTWDDTGKPLSMFGTHDDITDRKHHEQQLAAALSEKEVLLREVHHRVKNNLAAIISLMDMQRRTLEDPNGQIILTELINRIRSMSLVHEKLYRAHSLSSIDFHDYILALISHLRTTFGPPEVTCRVDAPGVIIPLDLATPCGLIVNELVTNALKYAFPNGKPRPGNTDCRILVSLHRDNDTYTLTVADNGIGWPAGFDWKKTKTLGLTLVRMLGQHQLGGHYVIDQENGTSLTLSFTDRKKEVPVHG